MKTPLETAQKIKGGCNRWIQGTSPQEICGVTKLCNRCRTTLTAKKEEWQNEIKFLEKEFALNFAFNDNLGAKRSILWRITELKKAVEIANG